jgi:co-chaperonin GroES (HSP10)
MAAAATQSSELQQAFPPVDPGVTPFGGRVLVQIRTPKTKVGSIILTDNAKDTEKWNTQVAKVISLGSIAFHDRKTRQAWPEGDWCKPGDFVRVPKYGGDRFEVPLTERLGEAEHALFVVYNDYDLIGKVDGDPLAIKAFV